MNKSMAYSVFPFAPALEKALQMVCSGLDWVATGTNKEKQQELLNLLRKVYSEDCESLDMKTIGSKSADDINAFLTENGFDIKLDKLDPGGVAVASILKILMSWVYEGVDCDINAKNGQKYKGVKMLKNIECFTSPDIEGYIVRIQPHEDFSLYLATIPSQPFDEQSMFALANELSKAKGGQFHINSVSFPEVEMNCHPDISWLCGLSAGRDFISQAVMQTKFKLDKYGAKAEAAVAVAVSRGISFDQKHVVFDKPFIAWIEKPGIEIPIFVSWCDYDSWKIITR